MGSGVVETLHKEFKKHTLEGHKESVAAVSTAVSRVDKGKGSGGKLQEREKKVKATSKKQPKKARSTTDEKIKKTDDTKDVVKAQPKRQRKQPSEHEKASRKEKLGRRAAARKAKQKARSASKESKNEEAPTQLKPTDRAHENFLASMEQDPHVLEQPGQSAEQQQKAEDQVAMIDAQVHGIRDFSNAKQVEIFQNGGMEDADREMKHDLEDMQDKKEIMSEANKEAKQQKKKRRKSSGSEKENAQAIGATGQGKQGSKKRKTEDADTPVDQTTTKKRRKSAKGFHEPMKQQT